LSGSGKGKTTSAFGMIMRCLGYGYGVGLVQFIKGVQQSGEELFIRENYPDLPFYQMGTGFTWDTQDRSGDMAAAEKTWAFAEKLLQDESLHLVVLDELTYMLGFKYLDEDRVLDAIRNRPREQTVVITGRGGGDGIRELADTVAEIESVKHAYESGVKAREGIDY
jgi:cob(I)alamin adenosyltransferase